jgi:hypothetical protein
MRAINRFAIKYTYGIGDSFKITRIIPGKGIKQNAQIILFWQRATSISSSIAHGFIIS